MNEKSTLELVNEIRLGIKYKLEFVYEKIGYADLRIAELKRKNHYCERNKKLLEFWQNEKRDLETDRRILVKELGKLPSS